MGWGHEISVEEALSGEYANISKARAKELFAADLTEAEAKVRRFARKNNPAVTLLQHQFDALTSLAFNSGYPGKRGELSREFGYRTENGEPNGKPTGQFGLVNHPGVAGEFLDITNGGLRGLVNRRRAERDMYLHSNYSGRP